LAQHLTDPRPENLILRCSIKDRKGEWMWADIDPLNWKLIVGLHNNELGVFEKRKQTVGHPLFLHGSVMVTVKYTDEGRTKWAYLRNISSRQSGRLTIDRPTSFAVSDGLL
jgi:hypothetical protein